PSSFCICLSMHLVSCVLFSLTFFFLMLLRSLIFTLFPYTTLFRSYNMNGIPIVVYGTLREWEPIVFRESLQGHFLISSSLIILGHFLGGFWTKELLVLYLFSLPLTLLAHQIGKVVYGRIPTHKFEQYIFF